MKFKIGQKVIITKNLGRLNGKERGSYYYGESVKHTPLGSVGFVSGYCDDHYRIEVKRDVNICMVGEEIAEYNLKEEQEKLNSKLEKALLADEPIAKQDEITGKKLFKPELNARKEFAIWIKQEFPELGEYAENGKEYKELNKRIEEVKEAALKAWEEFKKGTESYRKDKHCQREFMNQKFANFYDSNPIRYTKTLARFVRALEISEEERFPYTSNAKILGAN